MERGPAAVSGTQVALDPVDFMARHEVIAVGIGRRLDAARTTKKDWLEAPTRKHPGGWLGGSL
jgi:hypothetical protein